MNKLLKRSRRAKGFTLLEFVVAMSIFILISGVAFSLFNQQQNSAINLRDQAALNLGLRNAITQLQLDISNAGSGYFQGINMPSWPVGVTIVNNIVATGGNCYNSTTLAFGPTCFDQINIITAASPSTYPPVLATDSTGGTSPSANCSDTSTGVAYTQKAVLNGVTQTLAWTAAEFQTGDQVLFLTTTGQNMTTAVLTSNGTVQGSAVKLTFHATNSDGTNTVANDPLDITACDGVSPCSAAPTNFTTQFCGGDYIIKLAPIQYMVCAGPGSPSPCDQSNSSPDIQDPKLTRVQSGTASVVMDQVIGLKIGASLYNTVGGYDTSTATYQYGAVNYSSNPLATPLVPDLAYNFTAVRSVRISLIGRTSPNYNRAYTFRNTFNSQPYQIQGMTVVVNPRNMSMND